MLKGINRIAEQLFGYFYFSWGFYFSAGSSFCNKILLISNE
ncbi:hypothetical protein [Clostridium intestinale]|nr:hypothetical protein [Clostridium intestinale]